MTKKKELEPFNGSMANDMEELEQLGKQMEKRRTEEELTDSEKEMGITQHEKDEKEEE